MSGASISNGINSKSASLSYTFTDHLSALVASEGKIACIVKADIMEAYTMVLLSPVDQHLLRGQWRVHLH